MRHATYFTPHPPFAARGAGCWITDLDGRRIFDCANNFFSLIHGHAFAPVIDALRNVLDQGTAFGVPMVHELELAEEISARSPRLEQVRFVNSGTEAVMFAVKAARGITGRYAIAKFEGAYHGAYDPVEVSLDPAPQNWGEEWPASIAYARGTPPSYLHDTLILPFNDPVQCRRLLEQNKDRLAAVIFDPIASRVGMVPAAPQLLDVLSECCRRHGILLVLDEVISYRLGYHGAHAEFGLEPDLVALAKIIGGGLPIGAVAGPARHMAVFDHTKGKPVIAHGGTFSANPLSMVAGLAALKAYDQIAIARLNGMGVMLRSELNDQFLRGGLPAQVTGMGSLFRLHLTRRPITGYRSCFPSIPQKQALAAIHFALLERGTLLTPNCSGALSTPMTEGEVDAMTTEIVDAVREIHAATPWADRASAT
jgi:glutamate-1-semialdehyde 2,1-aminomutase